MPRLSSNTKVLKNTRKNFQSMEIGNVFKLIKKKITSVQRAIINKPEVKSFGSVAVRLKNFSIKKYAAGPLPALGPNHQGLQTHIWGPCGIRWQHRLISNFSPKLKVAHPNEIERIFRLTSCNLRVLQFNFYRNCCLCLFFHE